MSQNFDYGTACVRELQVAVGGPGKNGLPKVTAVELDGERLVPTPRFWRSFLCRFHIAENTFRYFTHGEVFERVSATVPCERFGYCIERGTSGNRLLAISSPDRAILGYDEITALAQSSGGQDFQYRDGIVTSTHTPRSGEHVVRIGGDDFKNRFVLETPIDGYGLPKIHLSLLRMICTNGAVGYSRAFRSEISVGKDPAYNIARALQTYDNDNGYAALWQRFESAQQSWASVRETQELYALLIKLNQGQGVDSGTIKRFYEITGRPHELYGLANLDALNVKRQRVLPTKCRVYDLINFASEIATHKAGSQAAKMLQAYIGTLISDEYDMEGTAEKVNEFQDFFLDTDDAGMRPSVN